MAKTPPPPRKPPPKPPSNNRCEFRPGLPLAVLTGFIVGALLMLATVIIWHEAICKL